ncbi:helix-turn-helix domain-containing protein [Mesorhizobium sp. M5C.F.Cr.IN.023.01.1.1]|uniref:helix-turn-helix domain-containing protein n=1 Tax=Mesorhizobium sp. M5C.F.Cr.IN.023.01.1.1 TaxID=2496768 RepID=UPI000FC9B3D4|nr:helix-turn-helix domain-containing protein [Mesorhizobium sp. M5C.F.Cr.IN.023.01.1.1]RUV67799.1 helix-turn-helix domain-containing protein [Mesorhizobium sp. M5C.F.Cr.IN.023.01.1.1]
MFEQIGAVLAGAPAERERTPVRRHSRAAGKCEGVFWRRTDRQQVRQIVLAAQRYELAGRQPGARNGPLGGVAIELLELFANLVDFRTGRLDPSIDTLMLKLRRSRDAIVRALKALRAHGFLDWLRRYVPTGNEGRGPQVQQTSNAYRMSLPEKARQLLGRWGVAPLPPDDHVQAEAERAAAIEAHRASLDIEGRTLFDVGDNPLGRALARLGKSIKQRESARQTESPSGFYFYRRE